MKNNKAFFIILLVFVLLIGGAYMLYGRLSGTVETEQLAVQPTPDTTTPSPGDNEADTQQDEETQKTLAPDFTVYDADGKAYKLSDFRGTPVVFNFWASWCPPCKSEMPDFETAYQTYGGEVQFLIINMTDGSRETVESAKSYIEGMGYTFPIYYDTALEAAYAYNVYSIPATYFVDAQGYCVAYANTMIDLETLEQGIGMIVS